jgi:hypothetical protein
MFPMVTLRRVILKAGAPGPSSCASFLVASAVLARIGDDSLGAHQIAFQLFVFLALVLDAIAIAGQVIVGRSLGAGAADDAYRAARRMIEWAVAAGALFGVVMLALIDVLPRAFTSDPAVIDEAQKIWPLFALMQRALQRTRREPLVHLDLFRSRAMSVGLLIMLIFFAGMGAFFVFTLHLQDGLGYSPIKTALAMLPATAGVVAGNGIGMPLAPRLGRKLPVIGLTSLIAGTVATVLVVTRFGADLAPWQLAVPVILFGAGLGLGASSLMYITLSGTDAEDAGAASGIVNTVIQLGMATGPATIGTVFFSRLAADDTYVDATKASLLIGLAVFVAALAACFLLPRATSSLGHR